MRISSPPHSARHNTGLSCSCIVCACNSPPRNTNSTELLLSEFR
uniref:Uncharacterized protein n=1 Tax=Arundo donax TaxID=35708 RepID=A0A0A8YJ12_ARUDO